MQEPKRISKYGIKYMTRSEANKIFYEIVDVDKMKKALGEGELYNKKKSVVLLKIRKKACLYDVKTKKEGRAFLDSHVKEWVKRFY